MDASILTVGKKLIAIKELSFFTIFLKLHDLNVFHDGFMQKYTLCKVVFHQSNNNFVYIVGQRCGEFIPVSTAVRKVNCVT